MATIGVLPEFDSKKLRWEEWCELLGHYLLANKIRDENVKKSVLLTSCGLTTYQLIRALLQPDSPSEKSFEELVDLLKHHFTPKPSEAFLKWKFNTRDRKPGESIASYVAELRRLSERCNFGDNLNTMLRDRLVCGVSDENIQRKLLSEVDLTFENAMRIAQVVEVANKKQLKLNNK